MPGRKVQRKRTGRTVPAAAKRKQESESSSSEQEQDDSDGAPPPLAVAPDEDQNKSDGNNDDDDNNDDDSFDSNKYEFSSGDESNHDTKDDDFSAAKAESGSENDEEEEEDSLGSVESTERPKRTRRGAVAKAAKTRTNARNRNSSAGAKKKKAPTTARKSRARRKKDESSDEEEFQEEEDESEHSREDASSGEEMGRRSATRKRTKSTQSASKTRAASLAKKRKARKSPRGKAPSRATKPKKEEKREEEESFDAESSEDESGEDKGVNRPKRRRKVQNGRRAAPEQQKRRSRHNASESESDPSEEEDTNLATPTRRPSFPSPASSGGRSKRASAQKAIVNLSNFKDEGDEDMIPKSFRKKKDDDEEFEVEDQGGDEEDSDQELDLEEDDDDVIDNREEADNENVGHVDDGDIGSAEESDDEPVKPAYQSPRLRVEHQSPSRVTRNSALEEPDDDSDEDAKQPVFSPSMPRCTSEKDAITDEDLPAKHVCCFSPDGKSRQCFALETLHKIATSTVCQQIRHDLTGRVVQTFLQPPHFRSAMSDDLLDQIASRFGRDALDLHGDYYKRKKEEEEKKADEEEDSEDDRPSLRASQDFVEQVQNYVRAQMGSRDLYVCPLCFVVARRKYEMGDKLDFGAEAEESDDTLYEKYIERHGSDPMQVLGSIDESYTDSFLMASSFCFPTAAKVKYHLREDHKVKTKNIEGNDLYSSYKMRATDGLLQRYLKTRNRGHVNQGAMQSYWFVGNNFDFVYLYSLVEHAAVCRSVASGNEDDETSHDREREEAEAFLEMAADFFDSFKTLASRLWHLISDPYGRSSEKDLKDFLADDNVEDTGAESDGNVHRQLDQERERDAYEGPLTQEDEEMIARYQREGQELDEDGSGSDGLRDSEASEEENEEVQNLYTSSSEEDEWEESIKKKRKAKSPTRKRSHRRRSRTSARASAKESHLKGEPNNESPSASTSSRKRLVIQDSDEE